MSDPKCLQSLHEGGMDAIVECGGCGRRVRFDPLDLYSKLPSKWLRTLEAQGKQLRCTVCHHRGAIITPAGKA